LRAPVLRGNRVRCLPPKDRKASLTRTPLPKVMRGLAAVLSLLLLSLALDAQRTSAPEYQAKANFLSKFPIFVEWPEEALPQGAEPFLLCIFGDFSFGTSLAEVTRGTTAHAKRVEVRWVRKEQDLHACHILFVSRSEQKRYTRVLGAVRGQSVLTVGETTEFLDAGGIVSFSMQQETLQFEVNLVEANKVHLRISSQMLALARRVVSRTEAAKS
jgi:hypothetical protein